MLIAKESVLKRVRKNITSLFSPTFKLPATTKPLL